MKTSTLKTHFSYFKTGIQFQFKTVLNIISVIQQRKMKPRMPLSSSPRVTPLITCHPKYIHTALNTAVTTGSMKSMLNFFYVQHSHNYKLFLPENHV
jgi:hypothetical protein